MSFTSWVRNLRSIIAPAGLERQRRSRALRRRPAARYRPQLEVLEDRLTPSTLTVNSLADNITDISVLTLRDAIGLVNNVGDPASLGQPTMPGEWSAQISGSFGDNDTIQFDSSLFEATPQTIILGGSELLLSRSMTLTGPGASQLAVSGNQASSVFDIAGGTTVGISGLTIENGQAEYGGGIINDGTLTLSDSIVSGNFVTYIGGGIYNSGTATISGTTLSGNKSAGGFSSGGGGITNDGDLTLIGSVLSDNSAYDGGGIQNYGTMTITGTTFSGNHGQRGGAIYNRYDTLTISDSALSDNSAVFGGAIYNESTLMVSGSSLSRNSATSSGGAIHNVATMTVNRSTLSGNSTKTGGGIYNDGKLTVSGSTLSDNSSDAGGGIYNFFRGTVMVSASTLSRNSAKTYYGGGIYNFDRGMVTVSNSTLAGNSASYGGGIYNPYGTLTLSNSTLSGNSAKTGGGGIYNGFVDFPGVFVSYTATLAVKSSIVAGNSGNSMSPDLYQKSGLPTPTITDSLIGDNSGTLLDETPVGAPDGNGNLIGGPINGVINPMLDPLAYNGGPTQTMALLAGSPAIDQGANPDKLTTDQRGVPFVRTFGSQTDMGAFELNAFITTSTLSSDLNPSLEGKPVTFTVSVSAASGTPAKGDVSFIVDKGTPAVVTLNNGTASLTADKLTAGLHNIIVSYAAQDDFAASSDSLTQTVTALTRTTSTLSSDLNPSVEGQPVTFSVLVSAASGTPAKGDVSFIVDKGTPVVVTLNNGTASLTADKLTAGPHYVFVSYAAQDGFAASSASLSQTVTAAAVATTTTVTAANATYDGSPHGATAVADVAGAFTFEYTGIGLTTYPATSTVPTNAGAYHVVATFTPYDPSAYHSSSGSADYTIAKATPTFSALTPVTIVAGTTSSNIGGKISLGTLVPTGSVAITVGAVKVSAAIHADGTFLTSVPTGTLQAGSYTITYSYGGDANFKPASATGTLVVLSAQQQISLIVDQVNALVAAGILNSGNGNPPIVKLLNNAIASLNSGKTNAGVKAGVNQLKAVDKQVDAFVKSGKLDSADAQTLLNAINEAIAAALASSI